jgi:hypothetical protein
LEWNISCTQILSKSKKNWWIYARSEIDDVSEYKWAWKCIRFGMISNYTHTHTHTHTLNTKH